MFVIGLTGGIGSGKSAAAQCFANLGIEVIDADSIAHQLLVSPSLALDQLIARYGDAFLNPDKTLNRSALRNFLLTDDSERHWVEQLLHPLIFAQIQKQVATSGSPYCIVVIPLLVETQSMARFQHILVIDVPESIQIERTMARDKVNQQQIQRFLSIQASRQERLDVADDIIDNLGNLTELKQKVIELDKKYRQLANQEFEK